MTPTRQSLEAIGERYHQFRAELMVSNNEGLTSTYNRFHDPAETSEGILQLRRLHDEMDQAVLAAYGWSEVPTTCGFGLDYLDTDDRHPAPRSAGAHRQRRSFLPHRRRSSAISRPSCATTARSGHQEAALAPPLARCRAR